MFINSIHRIKRIEQRKLQASARETLHGHTRICACTSAKKWEIVRHRIQISGKYSGSVWSNANTVSRRDKDRSSRAPTPRRPVHRSADCVLSISGLRPRRKVAAERRAVLPEHTLDEYTTFLFEWRRKTASAKAHVDAPRNLQASRQIIDWRRHVVDRLATNSVDNADSLYIFYMV